MKIESKISGLLLIDKMPGMTSHFVVSKIKRALGVDRVGHLGTLDPFASGLLPIMLNGATRLADDVMEGAKTYLFKIQFGVETDTLDLTGQVVATVPVDENFPLKLMQVLPQFEGEISQVPPVYSALKMNGMPLYEHMRGMGKLPFDIESKRRNVFIEKIEVLECSSIDGVASAVLRVRCHKGTYVRCLARDISKAIGTVGHCTELRRVRVEPWDVSDAIRISKDSVFSVEELVSKILAPQQMVPQFVKVDIDDGYFQKLNSGNPIVLAKDNLSSDSPICNLAIEQKLLMSCKDIMYLAEVTQKSEEKIVIQPRKKIF